MNTIAIPGKVILTCALTGGGHGKEANPSLPEQPDEIVRQGLEAWQAGAAILHIHARNPDGSVSHDKEIYREIHSRLCMETDAIIQLTTGGGFGLSPAQRFVTTLLNPEMCSLNMGTLMMTAGDNDWLFANSRRDIERLAREMKLRGIKPELEVYNIAMLEEVERLIEVGLLEPPYYVNLVLNVAAQGALSGSPMNLIDMVRRLPAQTFCNLTATGKTQLPLTTMAMSMGLNIRVGMEDNIWYRRGELVQSNAQLVARSVRIAHELNLAVARPDEVRRALDLRGRRKGETPAALIESEEHLVEDEQTRD
ncbi:MAG TPA: 3-keto-5-aminohexanoate cleavage protein [Ktedonobacteraceae bacterium]|nr:3-keto-5-aminohexanoate cleavage protein [Ktedonobacteraceae bacterium]